jgi:hypothetical protein
MGRERVNAWNSINSFIEVQSAGWRYRRACAGATAQYWIDVCVCVMFFVVALCMSITWCCDRSKAPA